MSETKELDGLVFRASQMPFRTQRKMFVFLSRKVSPALQELFQGLDGVEDVREGLNPAAMAKALRELVEHISDEDLQTISNDLGLDCQVRDPETGDWVTMTTGVQDKIFRGKLSTFFAWVVYGVEVNFADFFTALGLNGDARESQDERDQRPAPND